MFLDGKYETTKNLVETRILGAVSIDGNSADGYYVYIYIYTSSPYTMQVLTIIYGNIMSNGERVIHVT